MNRRTLALLVLAVPFATPSAAQRIVKNSCYANTNGGLLAEYGRAVAFAGDVHGTGTERLVIGAPGAHNYQCGCVPGAILLDGWGPLAFGDDEGDRFGTAVIGGVDLDGDALPDLVAGAPGDDDAGAESGSVRAITGAGVVLYTVHGTAAGDDFGMLLVALGDLDGDGIDDVLVGAPQLTSGGAGYARVISGSTGQTLRTHAGTSAGAALGLGLARLDDLDHDGLDDYALGAPREGGRGRVLVVSSLEGTVLRTLDGPSLGDEFGYALGGGADLDRDGVDELFVGAPRAGLAPGAAWAYSGRTGAVLLALNGEATGDWYGAAIAGTRDFDGDGHGDVIVAAPDADPQMPPCFGGDGTVFVVSGADASEHARMSGSSGCARLGVSVASVPDIDGNGLTDVAIGAILGNDGYGDWSCVTVLAHEQRQRIDRGPDEPSGYGQALASIGDLDGDGHSELLIGAHLALDAGGSATGMARVVSGRTNAILHEFFGVADGDQFGQRVANAGDVDGDGLDDLIVGAADRAAFPRGKGYARVFSGATGALLHHFVGPNTGSFGGAVAGNGDVDGDGYADLIVGGTHEGDGSVRVYSGRSGAELFAFDGEPLAREAFGASVSFLDDLDGDGRDEFLIGVPQSYPTPPYWSLGHIELRSGADGALLHTFTAGYHRIGTAITRLGDVNQDGAEDFAFSSWDPQQIWSMGSVHVVSGKDYTELWSEEGSTAYTGFTFGYSLATAGDFDGDDVTDLLVGVPGTIMNHARSVGTVQVRSGANGEWLGTCTGYGGWDYFGYSVAGLGDVNGDGEPDFAVGAPTEPNNSARAKVGRNRVHVVLSNELLKHKHCGLSRNSSERAATIEATGFGSLALNDVTLRVAGAPPNTRGVFFMGSDYAASGAGYGLRADGTEPGFLCLTGSVARLSRPVFTDDEGNARLAIDFASMPAGAILAGTSWSFQFAFADGKRWNASDAVRITFEP